MRVGIAGGGLGGLTAALFLLRAGVRDVSVFEQQASLTEIGAGIQVAPNAVRLLQRLGLGDALLEFAVPFEVAWEFRRWEDGRVLFSQRFGAEGEARFGAPYLAVHRADLLAVLASALPEGMVSLGRRVAGVDGSALRFADGSSETFDVVRLAHDGVDPPRRPGAARARRGARFPGPARPQRVAVWARRRGGVVGAHWLSPPDWSSMSDPG